MRLYLSSFKIGNQPDKLVSLVGPGKKAALVLNALDHNDKVRSEFLTSQTEALTQLGFTVEELDLRKYFGKSKELAHVLEQKDLVWVNGGNTFNLRRAMKRSGFDTAILQMLQADKIVYGGFSAGVCVITPTLKGLEITDNPEKIPEGYEKEIPWDGLNIIPYSVAVHYQSDHSESHLTDQEIEFYKKENMPFKTLRDGEAIIVNGQETEILH